MKLMGKQRDSKLCFKQNNDIIYIYNNFLPIFRPRRYEFRDLAEYVGSCIQKGPEDGWIITNMKYQPLYWLRIAWQSYKWQKYPVVDWEQIERVTK